MFLTHVLRWLPTPWFGPHARVRMARATPSSSESLAPASFDGDHALAAGQSTLLRLARGTVLHLRGGEISIEDAPTLWADHCWPQPMRLRAGESWVVPRSGWWRIDGRPSRDGLGRFSLRR